MKIRFSSTAKRIFTVFSASLFAALSFSGCQPPDTAGLGVYDEEAIVFKQLEPMEDGEEIAVVNTDLGEFKIRFFEEEAPNAVSNFKQLVKDGYYNNKSIYNIQRVQDESDGSIYNIAFMSGADDENGSSGKIVVNSGEPYPKELSYNLYPFPGAVAAYSDDKTCDSRFFVIGEAPISDSVIKGMQVSQFPPFIQEKFKEVGGVPSLTHGYTIFAHVFEGYDTACQLMNVEANDEGKPEKAIYIKSITLETFHEDEK